MSNQKDLKETLTNWETVQLRLTAFPSNPLLDPDRNWWKELTNNEPDEKVFRPAQCMLQESGQYKNATLILNIMPSKLDWRCGISTANHFEDKGFPSLGKFPDILNNFNPLIKNWFNLLSSITIKRLAFGAVLLLPVLNHKEGYEKISNFLSKIEIDCNNSTDFFYQINRPRTSKTKISDLKINRLTKWSVVRQEKSVEGVKPNEFISYQESFACRLELDMNTSADFKKDLPFEKLSEIFQELVDLGIEISEEGDIK